MMTRLEQEEHAMEIIFGDPTSYWKWIEEVIRNNVRKWDDDDLADFIGLEEMEE
jgi:hypothetical protein